VNVDHRNHPGILGPLLFVVLAFALTWASSRLIASDLADGSPATVLLRASLVYALVVGWQPLVAVLIVCRTVDRSPTGQVHRVSPRYLALAITSPILLLLGAAIVKLALGPATWDLLELPHRVSAIEAGISLVAFVGAVAVLWLQALVEETAWRGYLLPRLMQRLGPWPGLFVHGVLWGACYAPVFLLAESGAIVRIASFVVTCGLLGVLIGWLRLASGSIALGAVCNATLTIGAGLPLLLHGRTPMLGAIFEPAGWLPMLLLVATIMTWPALRAAVVVRQPPIPDDVN
jgi:membrane protease YdiL (CAAX protease family)